MNFNSVHRIPKLNLAIPLLLKLSCQGFVYVYKISKTEYDFAVYLVEHGAAS